MCMLVVRNAFVDAFVRTDIDVVLVCFIAADDIHDFGSLIALKHVKTGDVAFGYHHKMVGNFSEFPEVIRIAVFDHLTVCEIFDDLYFTWTAERAALCEVSPLAIILLFGNTVAEHII